MRSRLARLVLLVASVLIAAAVGRPADSHPRPERCDTSIVLLSTRSDGVTELGHTSSKCEAWMESVPRLGR